MDAEVTISKYDFINLLSGATIRKGEGDDRISIKLAGMSWGEMFRLVGVAKKNELAKMGRNR